MVDKRLGEAPTAVPKTGRGHRCWVLVHSRFWCSWFFQTCACDCVCDSERRRLVESNYQRSPRTPSKFGLKTNGQWIWTTVLQWTLLHSQGATYDSPPSDTLRPESPPISWGMINSITHHPPKKIKLDGEEWSVNCIRYTNNKGLQV
jgi:hypothetical protein